MRCRREWSARDPGEKRGTCDQGTSTLQHLRDLSCLLRCSLLEKARLQNWHLYFFSGSDDFLICDDEAVGSTFMAATGILGCGVGVGSRCLSSPVLSSPLRSLLRAIVGTVWRASVGVGFKVRLEFVVAWCSFVVDFWSSMGVVVYGGWPVSRQGRVLAWARTAFAGRARREGN